MGQFVGKLLRFAGETTHELVITEESSTGFVYELKPGERVVARIQSSGGTELLPLDGEKGTESFPSDEPKRVDRKARKVRDDE